MNPRHERPDEYHTIFSQIFANYNRIGFEKLRDDYDRPFSFNFIGEGSCDAGGPTRDVVTNFCEELMTPELLPLFIPTANNIASVEPYIDCFRLNPYLTEPMSLLKMKFLGHIIGCGIRLSMNFNIFMPMAFWNRICLGGESYVYTL